MRRFASKLNQTQQKGGFKGDNTSDKLANACKLDLSRRQLLNSAERIIQPLSWSVKF